MHTRNALWINNRKYIPPASEFIEIKMMADTLGKVYVPVAWCNGLIYTGRHFGNNYYDAPYDWDVLIDNQFSKRITWVSRVYGYEEVGSWLEPWTFHYIKIYPHNYDEQTGLPDYGWCMAFSMWWKCMGSENLQYKNPIADYLYEIIYDGAILWYRNSDHKLGSWYKTCQFAWCINLTKVWKETDLNNITEIWSHFLTAQYANSGVIESATESTPDCPEALTWFREQQYRRCSNLITAADEIDPPHMGDWYYHSYREGQYGYCENLLVSWPEKTPLSINGWVEFKFNQYLGCSKLNTISRLDYCPWYGQSYFRWWQFQWCGTQSNWITAYLYGRDVIKGSDLSLGLANDNVYRIYVPSNLVTAYQQDSQWSNIDDNKFVWM